MKSRWRRKAVVYSGTSLMTATSRVSYEKTGVNPKARKMTLEERAQVLEKIETGWNPVELRAWMSEELGIDRRAQTIERWIELRSGELFPNSTVTKNKAAKVLGVSMYGFNLLVQKGVVEVATGSPSRQRFDLEHVEEVASKLFGGARGQG